MKKSNKILTVVLFIIGAVALCYGCFKFISLMEDTADTQKPPLQASESEFASETIIDATETQTQDSFESISTEGVAESTTEGTAESAGTSESADDTTESSPEEPYVSPYAEYFTDYPDIAAWLQVPDTVIDYPVMWTPGDETYYLHRHYDGTSNQNGSLLLDTDSSLSPLTTNLIIHGHDMRSGAMFGRLTDYADPTYCEQHKEMLLFTEDCERKYEVIAVFYSQVFKKKDTVFKFYKFFQADTQEEFDDFYDNIMKLSLFDTGVTAQFGDRFLTLSTCSSHVENGRFVVVAKEITDDTLLE